MCAVMQGRDHRQALENLSSDYFGVFLANRGLQPQKRLREESGTAGRNESELQTEFSRTKRTKHSSPHQEQSMLAQIASHHSGHKDDSARANESFRTGSRDQRGSHEHHVDGMTCKLCGREFTRRWHAVDHVRRVHFEVKRFECTQCSVQFKQKTSLRAHMSSYHGVEDHDVTKPAGSNRTPPT